MSRLWKNLRDRLFPPPVIPRESPVMCALPFDTFSPVRPAAASPGYPSTYLAAAPLDGARQARVFDPALKQFANAFRPGDPTFANEDKARKWAGYRRLVTDHVLRAIAESQWGDRLILRGSRLSKAWLGDAAREPGDLDWVVDPPTIGPADGLGLAPRDGLIAVVFARPAPEGVTLVQSDVADDEIWTYERAEGRRVVFPWRAEGLPSGAVQVDVVFRESLAEPDRRMVIPVADGGCVEVRAAGPAQSLAWKLLWLISDSYPQGKDLYDAVLLAERFALPLAVLERTFQLGNTLASTADTEIRELSHVDWKNFQSEYPWVKGDVDNWLARLKAAIAPTFANSDAQQPRDNLKGMDPAWRTTAVLELARGIELEHDYGRLPILADALQEAGCENEDILGHCRGCGPHLRGCWVVDLVLGKE